MSLAYSVIEIFSSEEARCGKMPLHDAIVQYIRDLKIAGRCMVLKGVAACYENGEIATQNILSLSFNMPVKIEIVIPTAECEQCLSVIDEMVEEGVVAVRDLSVRSVKTRRRLVPRQMRVRDVMTPSPRKVDASTPASEAARLLLSSIFTGLPVVDSSNRPVGVITQGDLIYRANLPLRPGLLAVHDPGSVDAAIEPLAVLTAESIMTTPPICIEEDAFLTDAVDRMLSKKVKRLPVIGKGGVLMGMLSRLDIFQIITSQAPDWDAVKKRSVIVHNPIFVSDIMTRDAHAVDPGTNVEEVIRMIDSDDIQRVAVVEKDGRFLGLISDRDLLAAFSMHRAGIWEYFSSKIPFTERGRTHRGLRKKLREKTAAEVMETDLITVSEETGVDEAIALMVQKSLKRLPVIDARGRFSGMISRDALLRAGFRASA